MTPDIDVVVAGAGAAGLAAAISTADGGASVALLEAQDTFRSGSNTSMSTSMIPAGGSRWQAAAGIDDSPDLLYEDTMRKTKGNADPVVTRALVDVAPSLVDWLADDCGVPLELATDIQFPGHSVSRHHCVPDRAGRTLHRHLLEAAGSRTGLTLAVPMRVATLEETDEGMRVVATTPDGERNEIAAGAVVLATNGFAANAEMVERYIPEIAGGLYFGGDGSTGDALDLGAALGADTGYLDSYQGHGSVATPHGVLLTWTTVMNGAFLVNVAGSRFGDESTGYSEFAVPVLEQPGGVAWLVYDRSIHERAEPFADYQDLLEMDGVRWSPDVAAAASAIGSDPVALEATFADVVAFAAGTAADPFGRTAWSHLLEPPYATVKVTGALFHTQGGLRVDGAGRVLRGGEPIPDLYAAGGAAAGISGHGASGYMSGNGLLSALGLGYLAGRAITGAG